jgi:hypothetical protein
MIAGKNKQFLMRVFSQETVNRDEGLLERVTPNPTNKSGCSETIQRLLVVIADKSRNQD